MYLQCTAMIGKAQCGSWYFIKLERVLVNPNNFSLFSPGMHIVQCGSCKAKYIYNYKRRHWERFRPVPPNEALDYLPQP